MMLSEGDLQRLSEEVYSDRRINSPTFCAHCGYNLKTLPYSYRCPECGNEYNARPRVMKGIFMPEHAGLPFGEIASAFFSLVATAVIGIPAIVFVPPPKPGAAPTDLPDPNLGPFFVDGWRLAIAAVFAVFTIIFFRKAIHRTEAYFHDRSILKRIKEAAS